MAKATDDTTKPRKPRPETTGTPIMVRMQADDLQILDDWRRNELDVPGRAEAIRRLIPMGVAFDRERKFGDRSARKKK